MTQNYFNWYNRQEIKQKLTSYIVDSNFLRINNFIAGYLIIVGSSKIEDDIKDKN